MSYPILYKSDESDFFSLGLGPIKTVIEAFVTEERNGAFIFEAKVIVDDEIYPLLKENRIIKADASPTLTDQRFRIKRIVPNHEGKAEIYAEHVSYLTQELAMRSEVYINGGANSALSTWKAAILDDNPFIVDSDITTISKTSWRIDKIENPRQALGGVEGSILDIWGGEFRFDNYHISLLKKRGKVANTILAYGRNITDFEQERNIMTTYTTVYPYAIYTDENENEQVVTIDGYVVDCKNIADYPNRNVLPVDFSHEFGQDETPTKSKLKQLAQTYIKNNDLGIPKTSIKVSFLDLAQTADYADIAILESVELCDDVRVHYEKLSVDTIAKVIRTKWNVLRDAYDEIEIGEKRKTLSTIISDTQTSIKEIQTQTGTVLTAANGKNMIFYGFFGLNGLDQPIATRVGDMWYKPNGEDTEFYIWNGTVWEFIMTTGKFGEIDKAIEEAKQAGEGAQKAAEEAKKQGEEAKKVGEEAKAAGETARILATNANSNANLAKQRTDSLRTNINQIFSDISSVKKTVTGINGRAEDAFSKAQAVEKKNISLETTTNSIIGRVTNVETTATQTTKTLNELIIMVDGQKQTITSVTETATSTLNKMNSLESTVSGVNQQLVEIRKEAKSTTERVNAVFSTAAGNTQLITSTKNTAESALQKALQVETTANGLKTTISSVETTATSAMNKALQVEATANGITSTVAEVQGAITDIVNIFPDHKFQKQNPKPVVEGETIGIRYDSNGLVINNANASVRQRIYWVSPPLSLSIGKTYNVKMYVNSGVANKEFEVGTVSGENFKFTLVNLEPTWISGTIKSSVYTGFSIWIPSGTALRIRELYIYEANTNITSSQITQLSDHLNFRLTSTDGGITQIDMQNKIVTIASEHIYLTGKSYISNAIIQTAHIVDGNITTAKIANLGVTEAKIANLSVTNAKIKDLSVTTAKIGDLAVNTAKIANAAITDAKIGSLSANKVTTGTLNAANVNIINLNAASITTGYLSSQRIQANSITADKLAANAIQVGFNTFSNVLKLNPSFLEFYSANQLAGRISSEGMEFWHGTRKIGYMGEQYKLGNTSVRGIAMCLETTGDYVTWGYRQSSTATAFDTLLTLDPRGKMTGYTGLVSSVCLYPLGGIGINGAYQKLKFTTQTFNNTNYPYMGSENGKAGFAYGSTETYLISNGIYVPIVKPLKALSGLGSVIIPKTVRSDGTIATYYTINL